MLKDLFQNWITGKMSDFAGLFVFPLFWAAFLPRRATYIYVVVAFGFIFWKSPYSEPLIDNLNLVLPLTVRRIVDLSDLLALVVLAPSYTYSQHAQREPARLFTYSPRIKKVLAYGICLLSVFAFTATQFEGEQRISFDKEYELNMPRDKAIDRLDKIGLKYVSYYRLPDYSPGSNNKLTEEERGQYTVTPVTGLCLGSVHANITLHTTGNMTVLKLRSIEFRCNERIPEHKKELLTIFELEVVDKLRSSQ
jgi:hypothetical protein